MIKILLATQNDTKLKQMRDVLKDRDILILSLKDLGDVELPEEGNIDYAENAEKKCLAAEEFASQSGKEIDYIIADDSGFEITALNNFPGINSSRWGKSFPNNDDATNELNEKIKKVDSSDKSCRMYCILAIRDVHNKKTTFQEGEVKGVFTYPPRGNKHFMFDSVFVPDGQNRDDPITAAEMELEEKQKFSSRIRAFNKVKELIF